MNIRQNFLITLAALAGATALCTPAARANSEDCLRPPSITLDQGATEFAQIYLADTIVYLLASLEPDLRWRNAHAGRSAASAPNATPRAPESLELGCVPRNSQLAHLLTRVQPGGTAPDQIDIAALRDLAPAFYLNAHAGRNGAWKLPNTRDEFARTSNYATWPRQIVRESRVKGLTRIIYRSPDARAPGEPRIRVAETRDSQTGELNAPLRETEIIVERFGPDSSAAGTATGRATRIAPDWDFYVYDPAGKLSLNSEFRGRTGPVPTACMGCHYSSADRAFTPMAD